MREFNDPYRSKTLNINRPPTFVYLLKIGMGTMMVLFVLFAIPTTFSDVTDTLDGYNNFLDEQTEYEDIFGGQLPTTNDANELLWTSYLAAVVALLIFMAPGLVVIFWRGVLYGLDGLNKLLMPSSLAKVPQEFHPASHPVTIIKSRENYLRTLYTWTNFPKTLKAVFGHNSQFISPHQRDIAAANSQILNKQIIWGTLSILFLGIMWIVGQQLNGIDIYTLFPNTEITASERMVTDWVNDNDANQRLLYPFILFFVLQVAITLIAYFATRFMVPRRQPVFEPLENAEVYKGFGHPSQLFNRMPSINNPFQWKDFPNRTQSDWREAASSTVKDTGTFNGWVLIEQQPKPTVVGGMTSSLILLLGGWLMMLFATYLLVFELLPNTIPQFARSETGDPFIYAPLYVFAMGYVAFRFYSNGIRFNKQGMSLLESAWFVSQAILIFCDGNHSRADIRVGKATTDSIESSNISVRSDFTARFFAGAFLSEAPSLEKPRYLLGFESNQHGNEWIEYFRQEIHNLRDEGVRPLGVDIQSEEAGSIVAANVQVSSLKAGAETEARYMVEGSNQQPQPQLANGVPDLLTTGQNEVNNRTEPPKTVEEIEQLIEQLDMRLATGEISETIYLKLTEKWNQQIAQLNEMAPSETE